MVNAELFGWLLLADFQTQLASLPANASASVKRGLRTSIHSEEGAIKFYSYLVPVAAWLPSDPFQTIVIIVLALIMMVAALKPGAQND